MYVPGKACSWEPSTTCVIQTFGGPRIRRKTQDNEDQGTSRASCTRKPGTWGHTRDHRVCGIETIGVGVPRTRVVTGSETPDGRSCRRLSLACVLTKGL